MREIKFRAALSQFRTGPEDKRPQKYKLEYYDLTQISNELHSDFGLGQYTGLKDKNGKEIYEGDIIKSGTKLHKVIYDESRCGFNLDDYSDDGETVQTIHNKLEIVGNIYENPELLKDESNG